MLSMTSTVVHDFTYPAVPLFNPNPVTGLDFCNVTVGLTHPSANDIVYVTVWLPLTDWNGRYQATGGGGLAAGIGDPMLVSQVAAGYAASSTDGGLTLNNTSNPQHGHWALKPDGSPNEELQLNLAWRSIHDMAVISKDVIQQFYGTGPSYSYWHGCSQGGRQGYAAAAKYPHDFDGILAIAPAIDIAQFAVADIWAPVVMQNADSVPPFCLFEAYQDAIIAHCDPLDGVVDGLISDPELIENCPFEPDTMVGKEITCAEDCIDFDPITLVSTRIPCRKNSTITITVTHADIVRSILRGPTDATGKSLWHGLAPGASFFATANTVLSDDGTRRPQPFLAANSWVKFLALRNATYDMSTMTYAEFVQAFEASVARLTALWGNQQLDFTGFQESGGKLLTWFGLGDEYIPPPGIMRFRDQVEKRHGGSAAVDEFYRLFLAPGAGHCFGGRGPVPVDALKTLVSWVEHNNAPDVLHAATQRPDGSLMTRNLCRYPKRLTYREGDPNHADSFSCEG